MAASISKLHGRAAPPAARCFISMMIFDDGLTARAFRHTAIRPRRRRRDYFAAAGRFGYLLMDAAARATLFRAVEITMSSRLISRVGSALSAGLAFAPPSAIPRRARRCRRPLLLRRADSMIRFAPPVAGPPRAGAGCRRLMSAEADRDYAARRRIIVDALSFTAARGAR